MKQICTSPTAGWKPWSQTKAVLRGAPDSEFGLPVTDRDSFMTHPHKQLTNNVSLCTRSLLVFRRSCFVISDGNQSVYCLVISPQVTSKVIFTICVGLLLGFISHLSAVVLSYEPLTFIACLSVLSWFTQCSTRFIATMPFCYMTDGNLFKCRTDVALLKVDCMVWLSFIIWVQISWFRFLPPKPISTVKC